MPPDGVTVLAECATEWQANQVLSAYAKAEPPRQPDLTMVLGVDEDTVLRVRKTPGFWNVERWTREALFSVAEDEADVPF